MKNMRYALLLAALTMTFTANAQVSPLPAFKMDTALLKKQLKPQPKVSFLQHNFAAVPTITPAAIPVSVVKTTVALAPKVELKSNVVLNQPGSIHPTPLPSTTFQPALITSPGGTVSTINSQGMIVKRN